jgi:plasmid stabilization system protein ParE
MRVEYTKRATGDLRKVSTESRAFGNNVAAAVEARLREIIARISERPEAGDRRTVGNVRRPTHSLSAHSLLQSPQRQDQGAAHPALVSSTLDKRPMRIDDDAFGRQAQAQRQAPARP